MTALTRLTFMIKAMDKAVISRAAALMGMSMTAFILAAATQKAQQLLASESRITRTTEEFDTFTDKLSAVFQPNPALQKSNERDAQN